MTTRIAIAVVGVLLLVGLVTAAVVWTPWVAVAAGAGLTVVGLFAGAMGIGARQARRSSLWREDEAGD